MADKITMQDDGTLHVPDHPIIPFIEGDGTGVENYEYGVPPP